MRETNREKEVGILGLGARFAGARSVPARKTEENEQEAWRKRRAYGYSGGEPCNRIGRLDDKSMSFLPANLTSLTLSTGGQANLLTPSWHYNSNYLRSHFVAGEGTVRTHVYSMGNGLGFGKRRHTGAEGPWGER